MLPQMMPDSSYTILFCSVLLNRGHVIDPWVPWANANRVVAEHLSSITETTCEEGITEKEKIISELSIKDHGTIPPSNESINNK